MTWHQWHAEYPTDSRIGTSRRRGLGEGRVVPGLPVHRMLRVGARGALLAPARRLRLVRCRVIACCPDRSRRASRGRRPLVEPGVTQTLKLRPREDKRLKGGHVWIYSNEVDTAQTALKGFEPGEEAIVVNDAAGRSAAPS